MTDLMTELINNALDEGISVILTNDLSADTPPLADVDRNKIIINTNWYRPRQIPLQICHEIAHIKRHDEKIHVLAFSSIFSDPKDELSANTLAIRMLVPLFFDDVEVENINAQDFIDYFDIPGHLNKIVVEEIHRYVRTTSD